MRTRAINIAILIHIIGQVIFLIVIRRYRFFIQHNSGFGKWVCTCYICKPAHKFVVCTCASRSTYMTTVVDTEIHRLPSCSPIQVGNMICIGVQEYTILYLPPLCIHGYTTLRHNCKIERLSTSFISIPSLKHKAYRSMGGIWSVGVV